MKNMLPKFCLNAIFVEDPKIGGYTAFFAQLPNIVAEGKNKDEAISKLFELVQIVFEHLEKEKTEEMEIAAKIEGKVSTQAFEFSPSTAD